MISLRRPSTGAIAAYRDTRVGVAPTCAPADSPPAGFHRETFSREIGAGAGSFERARAGLRLWAAHRGAGVEVFPDGVDVAEGETVAILTRQLGLWVLATCRIESVIDAPAAFGFVYATLPDHPECGYEAFVVKEGAGRVMFDIEAVSRPGIPVVRLGSPVTRRLQRRATSGYLDALERWTRHPN